MRPFRSAADQLDQALDDVVAGDATHLAQHDPDAAATWELLAEWATLGGLDGLEPASVHVSQHDEDLIHAHERPAIMPHTLTMPPPVPASRPLPQSRPTRRSALSVTWTALAWLLIAAIGGGAIWGLWPLLNDREPTPTPLSALQPDSSEGTPEVAMEANPDLVANWAGEGNSWNMSAENPILGDPTILATLGGEGELMMSMPLVVGDSVYFSLSGPTGTSEGGRTIRYDLGKREVVWESPLVLVGFLSSDGSLLHGKAQLDDDTMAGDALAPVTLFLDSGQMHGATYLAQTPGEIEYFGAPYSEPGTTYWIDSTGSVFATNLYVPESIMVYRNGQLLPTVYNDLDSSWSGNLRGLTVVVGTDFVYAVRPSMTVVQFNRHSGQQIGSFNLVDTLLRDAYSAQLQLFDGRLIVTAQFPYDVASTVNPAAVVILNAETLEPLAAGKIPDLRSNTVATTNWVYVAARLEPNDPVRIYRAHPVSGTLGASISEFESKSSGRLSMAMAGNTLLVLDDTAQTLTAIDPEANTIIETVQLPPLGASPEASAYMGSVQIWNDHPVVVRGDGTIIVIGLED